MGQWDAVVTALIGGASEPAALHHRIAGAAAGCGNLRHRAARAPRVDRGEEHAKKASQALLVVGMT